jgi:dimethylargininase
MLLVNPKWVDSSVFGRFEVVEVDPDEPYAANGLLVGDHLIYPSSFPRTRERLEAHGVAVVPVDVSELQKAEGAVTCCSLIFARQSRAVVEGG